MPGITGVNTVIETSYRKVATISGNGTESFTLTSGVAAGTGQSYTADQMMVKSLTWSVSPGSSVIDSHVSILWENNAAGTTHASIMNCHDSGSINYASMGIGFKNNANIPTGNVLIRSSLGPSGAYTITLDVAKPYSGLTSTGIY